MTKSELKKEIELMELENKKLETINNTYKNKISEEIKLFNPKEIKNSQFVEKKYTLWERLLRTLRIN